MARRIRVKRTDTGVMWEVTPEYYQEYKSILEYIEEFDTQDGTKLDHPDKEKKYSSQMNKTELAAALNVNPDEFSKQELVDLYNKV